jgi:hypothetical protein
LSSLRNARLGNADTPKARRAGAMTAIRIFLWRLGSGGH